MWYVYILRDTKGHIYIGSTNDLIRRIKEHDRGSCDATRYMQNAEVNAYIEEYSEKKARELERYLKTGSGRAILHKRILSDAALA